jgi:ADP-ribosyl-[dinitrogen reductase] hydrolase
LQQHTSVLTKISAPKLIDFRSPMSVSSVSLSDRISGSLFGLLLCDSLGTAVECQSPGSFDPVKTLRGGGKFQLKPGQFTDDGSMALCLAVALLGSETDAPIIHPSVSQMNLYRRWYENGYLSSTGECFDIGITVRTALYSFISRYDQVEGDKLTSLTAYYGNTSNNASGNGSLMRLAPVPLLYHQDPLNAMNEAVNSSKTTHGSPLCLDSCRVYTALIIGALQGATKEELLNSDELYVTAGLPNDYWTAETALPLEPSVVAVMTGSYKHRNPPEIKASGFVIETMEAALWAFYHTNSFEEGALKAVNLGNDADTVGAVYGMLAGAYYGVNAIPTEWIGKCSFQGLVQTIVDEILIRSQQLTVVAAEKKAAPPNQPSLIYRRVLEVYNELAAFYSGTIKRCSLPCPKQYKSSQQFDEDITQFHSIYENTFKSIKWLEEATTDDEKQLIINRSDSILQQFLSLSEEDKRLLTIKWSRNLNHFQVHKHLPATT